MEATHCGMSLGMIECVNFVSQEPLKMKSMRDLNVFSRSLTEDEKEVSGPDFSNLEQNDS